MDTNLGLTNTLLDAPPKCLRLGRLSSPIGSLLLVTDNDGTLRALDFPDFEARMHRLLRLHYGAVTLQNGPASRDIIHSLTQYFAGDLGVLGAVRVATGGTPFQCAVWSMLRGIPAGSTCTYGALAARLDRPRATRAVGMANGANPIGIVVPCHRVIGANGDLTGYGGGLARKRWLLDHERRNTMTSDVIA